MKYSEIPQVDIWRNELDIDYHHSTILKLLVSMNIEYQRIPGWIKNTFGKVMKPKKVSDPPRTFPIDTKVDSMVKEKTPWQGTFAACFTHDVDTKYGYEKGISVVKEIEAKHDLKSTWFVVPSPIGYKIEPDEIEQLKQLRDDGDQIEVHGLHHDVRFAYVTTEERERRVREGKRLLSEMGFHPTGFRAPWFHRTRDLIQLLEKHHYQWDSTYPDTDPLTVGYEGSGCSTVFPFYPLIQEGDEYRYSKVLELPVTMPQDSGLTHSLGYSDKEILALWKKKVDYIESIGGLMMSLTHTDRYDMGDPKRVGVYEELIRYVLAKNPVVITCPDVYEMWTKKK